MTMWQPSLIESGPVYLAVTRALESDIRAGRLRPDDRLPTHRDLAEILGVNVGTVSRAYAEARRRGLIHGEVGRGTFVSRPKSAGMKLLPRAVTGDMGPIIDLGVNLPLRTPAPDLAEALRELAARSDLDACLGYQDPAGRSAVRAAGARWFQSLGIETTPEQVVTCAGAQHAILVALASVVGPGELVLAEELSYPGFLAAAKLLGLRVAPVAMDDGGIIPEALEEICRSERPRLLYCMPTLQNPTTALLDEVRRRTLARMAEEHDLVIVQDDVQGGLIDDPAPSLATLAPDRVLTIGGISKNLAPGLRVAFLSGARERMARLSDLVWSSVWMAPPVGAEIAARWIEDGTAARIARARRREMDRRHECVQTIFRDLRWRSVAGSYHLWLELEHGWTGAAFAAALVAEGIGVTAAEAFAVGNATAPNAVRISLSSPPDVETLSQGLVRVAHWASAPAEPALVRL